VTSYYIYYRTDPARISSLRAAVDELFKRIKEQTGVRGRWMRRRDDPTTYMEVYEDVRNAEVFEAALEEHCEQVGLQRQLARDTVRRREIFIAAE